MTVDPVLMNRPGTSHAGGPETEVAAAEDNAPRSGSQRARVLVCLADAGNDGMTDWELGVALSILRTSAGKRRKELCEIGLVEDTGWRRKTDTGSSAVVWSLTDEGFLRSRHYREAK